MRLRLKTKMLLMTSLRKNCPYSELFWSTFYRIRTEIPRYWPADQKNYEYEHFSRSEFDVKNLQAFLSVSSSFTEFVDGD